jgi:hypothetical protein
MQAPRNKRQKEQDRIQHQREKAARKEERKQVKANRPKRQPGDPDPDLAGLVAGPQPIPQE